MEMIPDSIYLESSMPFVQPGHNNVHKAMCEALESMERIAMHTKSLDVAYRHVTVVLSDGIVSFNMVPDWWERLLLDKLTVRDEERKIKESWERLSSDSKGVCAGETKKIVSIV
jgi:hypothetical protein